VLHTIEASQDQQAKVFGSSSEKSGLVLHTRKSKPMAPTRTERQKASWAHLCDDVLQDPQIQEFLHAMGVKNATQFIRIEDAFLSAPIVVNQGSEERSILLVPTMRNIIIDCKRWWASHPIKEVESWLELTTESLELFQEELFQQDQEANNKTKEAAAALETANLKSKEAAATLEAVNLKANDELNAAAKRTADEINAAAKRTADALNAAKIQVANLEIEAATIKRDAAKKTADEAANKVTSNMFTLTGKTGGEQDRLVTARATVVYQQQADDIPFVPSAAIIVQQQVGCKSEFTIQGNDGDEEHGYGQEKNRMSDKTKFLSRARPHAFLEGERKLRAEVDALFDPGGEESPASCERVEEGDDEGFDPQIEEPLEGEGKVEVELTNKEVEGEEAKIPKEFMGSVGGDAGREVYQYLNSAPFFIPDKLLGCAAVLQEEDKHVLRYSVVKKTIDSGDDTNQHQIKILVATSDEGCKDIISYHKLSDLCKRQAKEVLAVKSDAISVAVCEKQHGWLEMAGRKRLNKFRKRKKHYNCQTKATKQCAPKQAKRIKLDEEESDKTHWANTVSEEMAQLAEYKIVQARGVSEGMKPSWKRRNLHMSLKCKHGEVVRTKQLKSRKTKLRGVSRYYRVGDISGERVCSLRRARVQAR
jgi:hypothetical protein